MKNYRCKIKFVAPYLQARFSQEAKESLMKDARKNIIKNIKEEDLIWLKLSYFDDKGYYVPGEQIESAIMASAKDFKMKAARSNCSKYAKATIFVTSERNYLGKKEPDERVTSYPMTKKQERVRIIHPCFNPGNEVEFTFQCLDDDFSADTLKEMVENAGRKCGLGARRPKRGRFEVVSFKEVK